ncbi:MAG: hypothetical protein II839_11220 [Kiritimatiellae bacterium]|nr:hypothetical protein [Kiritimatiellia bacterium]
MRRVKHLAAILAFAAVPALAAGGAGYRFTATVNYAGAPASDVPAALRLSTNLVEGFDYAAAGDGTHFTITDGTGAVLPYEIDTWNPDGESLLWVKIPYFANGRKLTVIYGDTEKDMTTRAAEVWSNYIGVWHMNSVNALGKVPNSAGDARFDAEVSSFSRTGQAGKFGRSVLVYTNAWHGGKNDKERGGVFVPDGGNLDLSGDFAVSGWFYHTAVDNPGNDSKSFRWDNIFCKRKHPETDNSANEGDTRGFGFRIKDNKTNCEQLELYGSSVTESVPTTWPRLKNDTWYHLAAVFEGGRGVTRVDGAVKAVDEDEVGTVVDNDLPLSIGNNGTAWLDEPGGKAWGGRADEVRLIRGAPSEAWFAAEYAAMANGLSCAPETFSLTIDQNEHFDDAVTVSSDIPPAANGEYYPGTTVTLTAVPNATGTFRKWYGDVPQESWTNETVSFVVERDSWVYARFVHPWTLAADKATMTDGHFTVNVSVLDEAARTLTVGKAAEAGLSPTNDTGTGTIDLGGPIRLAGDGTTWRIDRFGATRGSQSFPISREGPFRYLSPGTVTTTSTWGTQLFHRGDTGNNAPPLFGAPYTMVVLDEPAGPSLICNFMFSSQSDLRKLIIQAPNVTELFREGENILNRVFSSQSLEDTRFDWWDLPSLSRIQHSFFVKEWGSDGSLRRRIPAGGALSLPSMRGLDWLAELSDYNGGTPLFLMRNVEEISLGGKDEDTTVTNLCTYAFAGDSSLRKVTLHAAPDIQVGKRIFADHTHNTFRTNEVIDGVSYSIGSQVLRGRVPDVIHFTGQAISETAISNLLDACPVASSATKPVAIHASRFQPGWRRVDRADWISDPTPAERAAYPGQMLIGVYRAGAEAPAGKAVIVHADNDWDQREQPSLMVIR